MTIPDFMKPTQAERLEASWCRSCRERSTCSMKEEVAFEEHMIISAQRSHLVVHVICSRYNKDISAIGMDFIDGLKRRMLMDDDL